MAKIPARRISAFYACYFAILGALIPYWGLYLKYLDFNETEIGELSALLIASKIIAPYLWGWLADYTGKRLALIRINTFITCLVFIGFHAHQDFIWFAAITLGFSFFWNATLPQFEAATLFHLREQPQRYNRLRLWGSIGFIVAVLSVGQLLEVFSVAILADIIIVLMFLNWLAALITPDVPVISHSVKANIRKVLAKPELWAFFLVYLLLQVAHGPYYAFYSVYLQQHEYSSSLTGVLWALGVIAEILLFLSAAKLLHWFTLRQLLLCSLLLSVLRWLIIAYCIDNLPLIIFAQFLHAATFGLSHVVAMQLLYRYFGDQLQGQGQALYASLCFGIGGMIGSLYSGYGWHSLGSTYVYVIAAIACGMAYLLALLTIGRSVKT